MLVTVQEFLATHLFVFLMIFTRFGAAMTVMPGIGDTFVTPQIRLAFALALSFVSMPLLMDSIPVPPNELMPLAYMIVIEFIIGIFIGTVSRILISAMATAGNIAAMQTGLANAQIFNPLMGGGTVVGSLLSLLAVALLFVSDLHHLLLLSVYKSYQLIPFGQLPLSEDMAFTIVRLCAFSFMIGVQFTAPFLMVAMIIFITLGILSRLMPQVQIFFIAMPIQIAMNLIILVIILTAGSAFFLTAFESQMIGFLQNY